MQLIAMSRYNLFWFFLVICLSGGFILSFYLVLRSLNDNFDWRILLGVVMFGFFLIQMFDRLEVFSDKIRFYRLFGSIDVQLTEIVSVRRQFPPYSLTRMHNLEFKLQSKATIYLNLMYYSNHREIEKEVLERLPNLST